MKSAKTLDAFGEVAVGERSIVGFVEILSSLLYRLCGRSDNLLTFHELKKLVGNKLVSLNSWMDVVDQFVVSW